MTIEVADLAKQPHASYDVVSTFDVIHDMADPMAVVQLGASIHFCMTTSLAQGGLGLGTVGLPEGKVKEFTREAGFTSVRPLPVEHPLNVLYEIRP